MLTTDLHHANIKEVTIIYYGEQSLELYHSVEHFPQLKSGRVVIPELYKQGKSIIAVCEGSVNVLNKFGERIEFQQPLTQVV